MPLLPPLPPLPSSQITDPFNTALSLQGKKTQPANGFQAAGVPSATGLGTRTGRLPAERQATPTRKLIHWLVPEGPIVQMYVNPNRIVYNDNKSIERARTKGGWVLQYWGEELSTLDISGTTGTSGIEGINVLRDLYRNEQIAFDPFALFLAQRRKRETLTGDVFGTTSALFDAESPQEAGETFVNALVGASQQAFPQPAAQRPTLASLAFQVEMFWSGEVYRGYFENFTVTEAADNLGMFDYSTTFVVTQKRGFRQNFLGWHRSPVLGPSNSNPEFGPPHSFGSLVEGNINPPQRQPQADVISVNGQPTAQRPNPDPLGQAESLGNFFHSIFS